MINRATFFSAVRSSRLFGTRLSPDVVMGIEAILDACDHQGVTDTEEVAYILATAKWETSHTMEPIREYGRGKGKRYGRPDTSTGMAYYGRGLVQLTWKRNYARMGTLLGIDLVHFPDRALNLGVAAKIIVIGMRDGLFAPAAGPLSKYLGVAEDWLGARKTVNGSDRAKEIAAIAIKFDDAIEMSNTAIIIKPLSDYTRPPKAFKPSWQKMIERLITTILERFTR